MLRPTVFARAALVLLVSTTAAAAQDTAPRPSAWQFRIASGALVTTGEQRDQIKDANLTAAQLSWSMNRRIAFNAAFSWARSRDLVTAGTPKLDVFTSDAGAEVRSGDWFNGHRVSLTTFAGLGAGARSYNYRNRDVRAANNFAGYGSIGGELGMGRVGLRLEARNYATGFTPLVGSGKSVTRNDVTIFGALRINAPTSSQK